MKRITCCIVLLFMVAIAFSQKVYFVYLQTDMEQPFYVRINEKVFSSSSSGYLILSRLKDSTYNIRIGFPGDKWPEQSFKINIAGKDRGYQVKNFPDKGWGLIDLQTLAIQMSAEGAPRTSQADDSDVSPFTAVLALASGDPTLKEKPQIIQAVSKVESPAKEESAVAPPEQPQAGVITRTDIPMTKMEAEPLKDEQQAKEEKPVSPENGVVKNTAKDEAKIDIKDTVQVQSPANVDTLAKKQDEAIALKEEEKAMKEEKTNPDPTPAKPEEVAVTDQQKTIVAEQPGNIESYKPSRVRKKSESSTTEGFGLTFIDEYPDGTADTVRLMIPNQRTYSNTAKGPTGSKEQAKEERQFLDISSDATGTNTAGDQAVAKQSRMIMCSAVASETEFLKLRRNMAAKNSEEGMMNEAAKAFKSKCFSVVQVKNLSALFLDEANKYKFFQAAYTHVSDPANFATLQSELKDERLVGEFRSKLQ